MRRKREKVQPIEGLEPELISQEMIDGLMPVDLTAQMEEDVGIELRLEQRRYERARRYLVPDGNTWTIVRDGTWKRTFKGSTLYYYVFRDKLSVRLQGDTETRWFPNAFNRLYMMLHTEGFEPNKVPRGKPKRVVFPLPNEDMLTPSERAWLKNIPPSNETLRLIFGYDADWEVLYYVNADRDIPEIVPPRPFVKIDDVPYATSRVISTLVYGNPHGVPDAEKAAEILSSYPGGETTYKLKDVLPNEKPAEKTKRPVRKRLLRPYADKPFWRLKASEQARILLSKEPRK